MDYIKTQLKCCINVLLHDLFNLGIRTFGATADLAVLADEVEHNNFVGVVNNNQNKQVLFAIVDLCSAALGGVLQRPYTVSKLVMFNRKLGRSEVETMVHTHLGNVIMCLNAIENNAAVPFSIYFEYQIACKWLKPTEANLYQLIREVIHA